MGAYSQVWLPSGAWGGVNYPWPVYPVEVEFAQVPARTTATSVLRGVTVRPQPGASAATNATLIVQFPADAEIWVGGKKSDGDPATEWTLTSPTLEAGAAHTFEVKGRWKADGKTFETSRSVTVTAGDRNRLILTTGTAVK
jgi:uncharacterized protein (TIGR03000 family)